MNHLSDGLRAGAESDDSLFIELPDGRRLGYGDAWRISGRMANALVSLGVQPGERVLVQAEKSIWMLMLYLACIRAGAIYLPLNTAYAPAEMEHFIGDSAPRLIVTEAGRAGGLAAAALGAGATVRTLEEDGTGSFMEAGQGLPEDFADRPAGPDDIAAILYTSGTTGRSKGAMLSHRNLLSNALALKDCWRFDRADRLIHALPIFHAHGLFVAVNTTMVAGASMHFLPRFDRDTALQQLARGTVFMGVPTYYVRLLQDARLDREAVAGMRLFISGSAPLLEETHRAFAARTGHAILERYGMTETLMNTSNPYAGERRPGTVGFALPGTALRIRDMPSGRMVGTDETGMIEVRGPNVFRGYWRQPAKTAADFTDDGWFVTGDLGRIDSGGYLHIVGRDKDLIISGGFNVYPREVETEINLVDGVEESAVIGLPHPDFGEAVTAVVVAGSGAGLDEPTLIAALSSRIARFKQPKRVIFVEALPRNTMGKVQKNVLRDRMKSLYLPAD